jgi:hypothetical protein
VRTEALENITKTTPQKQQLGLTSVTQKVETVTL